MSESSVGLVDPVVIGRLVGALAAAGVAELLVPSDAELDRMSVEEFQATAAKRLGERLEGIARSLVESLPPLETALRDATDEVRVESLVAFQDSEPFVLMHWGAVSGQFSLAQAREHAMAVLSVAEASEHDAAMARWMTARGMEQAGVVMMIRELRAFRGQRRPAGEVRVGEVDGESRR